MDELACLYGRQLADVADRGNVVKAKACKCARLVEALAGRRRGPFPPIVRFCRREAANVEQVEFGFGVGRPEWNGVVLGQLQNPFVCEPRIDSVLIPELSH